MDSAFQTTLTGNLSKFGQPTSALEVDSTTIVHSHMTDVFLLD
ncbi:MAG TPA: hypothetical protein VD794_00260 [Flavisolibacter sp.]|nr:hypothetical protein [Flavisolibacter sp.]